MPNLDINIKEISKINYHVVDKNLLDNKNNKDYSFKVPISSKLVLEFSGQDNANVIVNTLRRVLYDNIPTYAFSSDLIKISDNNTIFNNDYMRLRLSQLPVLNTDLDIFFLDPIYWLNNDYSDPKRPKHPSEKRIEIAINVYNDSNFKKNITTNDIHYYEDGVEVQKYNRECPILLIQLRPAETFKCTMKAVLGVGERDNIWASVADAYYDDLTTDDIKGNIIENPDKRIIFTVESQGQEDEYVLLIKACNYIIKKLDDIRNDLNKKFASKEIKESNEIILVLDGEDHTMGQLLNFSFQNHPDILYSGVAKPDHLVNSIRFKVSCADNIKSPIKPIFDQINLLKELYLNIEKQLVKLNGKYNDKQNKKSVNNSRSK